MPIRPITSITTIHASMASHQTPATTAPITDYDPDPKSTHARSSKRHREEVKAQHHDNQHYVSYKDLHVRSVTLYQKEDESILQGKALSSFLLREERVFVDAKISRMDHHHPQLSERFLADLRSQMKVLAYHRVSIQSPLSLKGSDRRSREIRSCLDSLLRV